ncbi:MAG TPA: hypothetical protein VL282_07340, partial [Tepidisphaeraceae bacterium]|nr:hypothetical protein [Tepidisphaeraceae bacterium]
FAVLPVMVALTEAKWSKRFAVLVASTAVGIAVYAVTNPFVIKHLLTDPQMLRSNLGNSSAMYQAPFGVKGLLNALILVGDGATPVLAVLGVISLIVLIRRQSAVAWLLAAVTVLVLVQFVLLATGKPAEYARFALVPDVVFALAAVVVVGISIQQPLMKVASLAALCVIAGIWGAGYVWHYGRDSVERTTRIIAAERLEDLKTAGATSLALDAEPAPYSLPPVDLFHWKLVLIPRTATTLPTEDVYLRTVDRIPAEARVHDEDMAVMRDQFWIRPRLFATPIAWAAKPFRVTVERNALDAHRTTTTLPSTTESADK